MKPSHFLFVLMSLSLLAACDDEPAESATSYTSTRTAPAKPKAAPEDTPGAVFDINQIPVTDKPLDEFPFFTSPEGHKYVSDFGEIDVEPKNTKEFDRYYFVTNKTTLHQVEGKTFRVELYDNTRNSWIIEDAARVEQHYENAITAAGGVKVFDGKADIKRTYDTLETVERSQYAPRYQGNKRQIYVIRQPNAEVWIEISCGKECSVTVARKSEKQPSIGLIPASDLKDALDKEGHVALYINFDTGTATIPPDSQDIVAEIVKLLESNPDLKIRIEGHTDDTGNALDSQTLTETRANALFSALLAKGIPKNRLEFQGFGGTKPVAENKTEKGRAKNQRIELVKL
ncbi:hypothetical protein FACS1894101_2410 [Betaproteobacteria bacterium]|nr:hypothetical protein FACS1894101_2410 [Betaproteobacteria bacterium]